MSDTSDLRSFLIDGVPYFLVNLLSFVTIAVILLVLDWRLALLVFVPIPVLVLGGASFWRRLMPMFHKHGNRRGRLHTILGESIRGVQTVKSLAQERRRETAFEAANEEYFDVTVRVDRTFQGFFGTMSVMMAIGTVLVWYAGGDAILRGVTGAGLGTLLAFVGYMALFYGPLQWFSAVLNWATNALAAAERIFAVLDQPEEGTTAAEPVRLGRVRGAIRFDRVRFSYERGREVIKGIDLEIAPGEMIGLVGKSGAGKSTIINLISRFYDPDSGTVTVDGVDLRKIDLAEWRTQVGIVMQSPYLFDASILDNIRYRDPAASFERVVAAARAARAHDFISAKEDGYDTVVGDGGSSLSGGERQRVAIARAILHDPPVLILDEATSAVDSETEKQIQEAIANLVRGRTTIAIAHRLATLRNADRLVVIEDGRIVEQGTHEELLAIPDGVFAKLVKLQTDINRIRAEQAAWRE
jgi:ATP-binding cassette subfamily B protein